MRRASARALPRLRHPQSARKRVLPLARQSDSRRAAANARLRAAAAAGGESAAPSASYARYDSRQALRGDDCERAEFGEPAGFWIRLAAFLIDVVVWFAIAFSVYASGFGTGDANIGAVSYWVDDMLISAAYYVIQWTLWQTTVGKRIFGLYVVGADGSKIGFQRAFRRYLAYFASATLLAVGFLMIAFRQDKRGLHDLQCDTVVVRRW